MSELNLESMDLGELKALQRDVNKAIASYEDRKKKEAVAKLEATAREMGFSVAELMGGKMPRARSLSAPRFANPEDRTQTWTGKGRKPEWYKAAIAEGKTDDDLRI